MTAEGSIVERRLLRLADELAEIGLVLDGSEPWHQMALVEVDYALRPAVHERRVPSYGAIVDPTAPPDAWVGGTQLAIDRRPVADHSTDAARRYADGVTSWLIRRPDGDDEWAMFDRPAGSERDLVVLSESFGATVVQRHPGGLVRIVTAGGVCRWDGIRWRHQPLVSAWMDVVAACKPYADRDVVETLLEFAVHDLGSQGLGATLVYHPDRSLTTSFDTRYPAPPPLYITRPTDLAPLRHALAQIDGAALFDESGTLTDIGVRLVPSTVAEQRVAGVGGTRHTSGRRYSFDDPSATVIVVSEDGPVTVMRAGHLLSASSPGWSAVER